MIALPTSADVSAAAARIKDVAVRTPLLTNARLDEVVGARVFVKPEVLQRTGSFKFRGAYNRISQIAEADRAGGVVAWSSGNHSQGVAAASTLLGLPSWIAMPKDAPQIKVERTRAFGAEVVFYDRFSDDREAIGRELAAKHGAVIVPPYDDLHIIAGQGTAGLEIAEDAARLGVTLDTVLVPAGGGGLAAGTALAFGDRSPTTQIYCVEPDGFDDHGRSLISGEREKNADTTGSFCDALMAPMPGEITFAINAWHLAGGLSVSDVEVADAMRFAYTELKLVVEPGGAVALAALLSQKIDVRGQAVALVLSGGNVDPVLFAKLIV
ncbi:MAG: threonine/serine dehydratase [Parvibaculum sp.]|nr:threonine/serine dehydratase [Parvibaculum sp.]